MLLRLVYLSVTNVFALLRLFTVNDRDKEIEILALRHQITFLQRQLGGTRPPFRPGDRALLAALLHQLPRDLLGRIRLLVRPDTVIRWHRDLLVRPVDHCGADHCHRQHAHAERLAAVDVSGGESPVDELLACLSEFRGE